MTNMAFLLGCDCVAEEQDAVRVPHLPNSWLASFIMQRVHIEAFDLNLLLAFDALWTERHVTRAARRVGLTQSAMSHALGRLRLQLDDPLFQPTPARV